MSEAPKAKGNYITQAWLVILLALLYGAALAGVQVALSGQIAANKTAETYDVVPQLVPGAVKANTREVNLTGADGKPALVYQAVNEGNQPVGWVVPAGGIGFADRIEVIVGFDAEMQTITGLYVLDQKETPGLGDYITGEDFRKRFVGKPADPSRPVQVVKSSPTGDTEVLALTGATISSDSVAGIVNGAVANLKEAILKAGPQG